MSDEVVISPVRLTAPEVVPGGVFGGDARPEDQRWKQLQDILNNTIINIINNVALSGVIGAVFDGGGSVLTVGAEVEVYIPFACTITGVVILADATGSIEFEVEKATYADYDTLTSIVASDPPTVTADDKSADTTLTGWTTSVAAGDVIRFSITSVATITRAEIALTITKTAG